MNLKNYFDVSRFWQLLKMEFFRSRKALLLTVVITFGLLFFVGFLLAILVERDQIVYEHAENYAFTLIAGGFIVTSLAFNDLSNSLTRFRYLTLPASTLEKLMSMWLLTSVGWIVVYTTTFTVYSLLANAIGQVLFNHMTFEVFDPFGAFATNTRLSYFVLQGIFLVGAAHFKGYVFPKTTSILLLFLAVCGGIIYFIMYDTFMSDHVCTSAGECELVDRMAIHKIWAITKWFFWWILAPLSWVITYLGLKEQEV